MSRSFCRTGSLLILLMTLPSPSLGMPLDEGFTVLNTLTGKENLRPRLLGILRAYIGRPYAWGGSSMINGLDCSSFTRQVMRQMGAELPRTVREQAEVGKWMHRKALKAGDLVFFDSLRRRPGVDHVGIYLGNGDFAHSSKSRGVVLESLDEYGYRVEFGRRIENGD